MAQGAGPKHAACNMQQTEHANADTNANANANTNTNTNTNINANANANANAIANANTNIGWRCDQNGEQQLHSCRYLAPLQVNNRPKIF